MARSESERFDGNRRYHDCCCKNFGFKYTGSLVFHISVSIIYHIEICLNEAVCKFIQSSSSRVILIGNIIHLVVEKGMITLNYIRILIYIFVLYEYVTEEEWINYINKIYCQFDELNICSISFGSFQIPV